MKSTVAIMFLVCACTDGNEWGTGTETESETEIGPYCPDGKIDYNQCLEEAWPSPEFDNSVLLRNREACLTDRCVIGIPEYTGGCSQEIINTDWTAIALDVFVPCKTCDLCVGQMDKDPLFDNVASRCCPVVLPEQRHRVHQ